MIRFHFLTLFPEVIHCWLQESILGRALEKNLFSYETHQIRDFATDKHRAVDDTAYGGGGGMVFKAEPLALAVESLWNQHGKENCQVIALTPGGQQLNHSLVTGLSDSLQNKNLVLVCGHYEGFDQRFLDHWVDQEISVGDFVVSGGEVPALLLADALIRQQGGTLGHPEGSLQESFSPNSEMKGLLEYPHYTRPINFRGHEVPPVLLNGNHSEILKWRLQQAHLNTQRKRPDLLSKSDS